MSGRPADRKIPVLVVFAPTASGKTELLWNIFSDLADSPLAGCAEIISADSMQVYTDMNIGTAKPSSDFLRHLPHHVIDVCPPSRQFSVSEFVRMADESCNDIVSRGKFPVVCGGTAFYIKNFIMGLPVTPQADAEIRSEIQRRLSQYGAAALHNELQKADPASAARIHANDAYRIARALEVFYASGRPLSDFPLQETPRGQYDWLILELTRPRDELYRRIDLRAEQMFADGLAQEVRALIESGYSADSPGMQAIGYREFFACGAPPHWSDGELRLIKERIKLDSRHYAKRQTVFFRSVRCAERISADSADEICQKVMRFYRK
ncbi:MAG: tRNA (adenosine(37)-N6)-dimethylallyltransferase MiaA [Treponema brennaborense]|nr:tRNA (adenosine(37)-N6)-dimethylallyltransferase MiaA [Treponema brennaborense]